MGSLRPALPCLHTNPSGLPPLQLGCASAGPLQSLGGCAHPLPQLKGLASVPSHGAAASPQKRDTQGASLSAFNPHLPGRDGDVANHPGFPVKLEPALPLKVTRCCSVPSSTGPGRGIIRPPKCPALPVPPLQVADWEIPPQPRCVGDADGPSLPPSAKDKTSDKPVAGDKREWVWERPPEAPPEQWQSFRERRGRPDKGARCPQTPAAASAQNRGVQIWPLSSPSS